MNTPTFCPINQQRVSPDNQNSEEAPPSQSNPTRAPPTGPRGWSHHRPRSPRVVVPVNKQRRRKSRRTPLLRRKQPPREAKPLPSVEISAQKAPFDPYAFLRHAPTPSLPSLSPSIFDTPGNCRSDVDPHDANPHLLPALALDPRTMASADEANKIKRENSFTFTPVIKHPFLDDSLQTTQARERKLKENDVVELDRDEYALQRFLKVQGELTDLEAILLNGKKKHVFEQIKRNAAIESLRGVEETLAENDATPTPSGRSTTLQDGTTGEMVGNKQRLEVLSKLVDMRTETSQRGPASTQDAPSTSVSGEKRRGRPRKEHGSDHGAVHPSRRHVFDHSEGSQRHKKSNAAFPSKSLKRKELPGMGIKFNARPNPTQDAKKYQEKKLPRDLQRRQVDMPEVKNTAEKINDADIENTIDLAQNWLQQGNSLEQEARAKRWEADATSTDLTIEQVDAMRRQGSIPPAQFYGHPPKWRPPPEWRQSPAIGGPIFTSAEADAILARIKRDRVSRLSQHTKDKDRDLASSELPRSRHGKQKSHRPTDGKIQSSTCDENQESPTRGSKDLSTAKVTSTSQEEEDVIKAVGHVNDSQRSMRDDRSAVETPVKPAKDKVKSSKTKSLTKKRKRGADVSETLVTTCTMKDVPVSPDLPSMKEIIEGTQVSATSSPVKKKKKTTSADSRVVEDVVSDAKEQGSQMAVTSCQAQRKKSKKASCTEAIEDVVNDAKEPSTPSRPKKRKKAKETMEVHEIAGEERLVRAKKPKRSGQNPEVDESFRGKARSEKLVDCLRKMNKKEKTLDIQEAANERSHLTIPTSEATKTKKLDRAPPTAPVPAVEDVSQPIVDDDDEPLSPPQPSPSRKKKQKSKHRRPENCSPATAVNDNTPGTIETQAAAPSSSQSTHSSFNHHRRRHRSLPPLLTPKPTHPTANSNTNPPESQAPPIILPQPNLYDLNLLAIRTRLSNLEAAIAANPTPSAPTPAANTLTPHTAIAANPTPPAPPAPSASAPTPNTLTRYAALKLRFPPLPCAIPPGTTRLSDAELIQIGKRIKFYERHTGAPYAFSWRGRLYAEYDHLLDWVDDEGRAGWDYKEKARVKNS